MFKARVAFLGLLALFIVSGFATSVASAAGPYWKVNGVKLTQTKVQVKLLAGKTELKAKVSSIEAQIQCGAATVQNAYIEGNGTGQGQDSASSISFVQCKVIKPPKCIVTEPIITVPVKSHLVLFTNSEGKEQIGDLFEPTQGTTFASLTLNDVSETEKCSLKGVAFVVKGSTVAEVKPEDSEVVSGEINFPETPIKKVKHEGVEVEVPGLSVGALSNPAVFSGKFEARLVSGLNWGAFKL